MRLMNFKIVWVEQAQFDERMKSFAGRVEPRVDLFGGCGPMSSGPGNLHSYSRPG